MHIFDIKGLARYGSEIFDVPTEVTKSEEQIVEEEQQQAEQEAQLAQAQQAQALASAAKDGADAFATAQGVQV